MQQTINALHLVHSEIPDWAELICLKKGISLNIIASPLLGGGIQGKSYNLDINLKEGKIVVKERNESICLPKSCPERHINHDGTFCIGLNSGKNILNKNDAFIWWKDLKEFLNCQHYANKRRSWPRGKWLSHGNEAATHHLAIEKIAEKIGWQEEVIDALEYKIGWLGGNLPKLIKDSKKLLNQKSPCPRGCYTKKGYSKKPSCICNHSEKANQYGTHKPVTRRRCPNLEVVSQLIWHETQRRQAEKEFWNSFKNEKCCGTMNNCPLNNNI